MPAGARTVAGEFCEAILYRKFYKSTRSYINEPLRRIMKISTKTVKLQEPTGL